MTPQRFIFFLLMPIFVPIALFFQLTYTWWVGLRTSGRILFFILLPIYAPLALFMNWLFPVWTDLAK
jgi:hypothetical protein